MKIVVPVKAPCFGLSYELIESDNYPPPPYPHLNGRAPLNLAILVLHALFLNQQYEILEFIILLLHYCIILFQGNSRDPHDISDILEHPVPVG